MNSKSDYLKIVRWSDEDLCFVGSIPDVCGDCCHGDDEVDVYAQLVEIHDTWIKDLQAEGKDLPPVRTRLMVELAQ